MTDSAHNPKITAANNRAFSLAPPCCCSLRRRRGSVDLVDVIGSILLIIMAPLGEVL
jgi:hypothetical protein